MVEALAPRFGQVLNFSLDNLSGVAERFVKDAFPVAVFTSLHAYQVSLLMRTGRPFVAIGLEHGVAPYKAYTYNEHFLDYDAYISPTELWRDRLIKLFPDRAETFTGVAYPRFDDLADRFAQVGDQVHAAWRGAGPEDRDLVILSWGVNFEALVERPDRPGLVYLVHPAMARNAAAVQLAGAEIVVSTPQDATVLLANAQRVFGDFSSMTLEAAVLKPQTFMFIDRQLYMSDCGMLSSFFDRGDTEFGRVPQTQLRLPIEHVLSLEGLRAVLMGQEAVASEAAIGAWSDISILPTNIEKQAHKAAVLIEAAAKSRIKKGKRFKTLTPEFEAVKVVGQGYRQILGREPDPVGLLHHVDILISKLGLGPVGVLAMYASMAQSQEAQARWQTGTYRVTNLGIQAA